MTVDKEILAQIQKKKQEQELKSALKEMKKGKKKEALKGLLSFLGKTCGAIKTAIVWIAKGAYVTVRFIFNGVTSFGQAVNMHVDMDIAETGPIKPSKIRNKFYIGMASTFVLGSVITYLVLDKLPDSAVASKQTVGESIVMASEMSEEDAKVINNVEGDSKARSITQEQTGITQSNGESVVEQVLSKDVTLYLVGDVSTKFELGEGVKSKSAIVDSGKGEIKYGQLSSLSTREDYVLEFCRYLKTNHNDVYTKMFSTAKAIGSKEFNECWENASQYNEFVNIQIEYKWNKLVKPVIDTIKSETNVDLNKTLVGQEIAYSTVSQYGTEKAMQILKVANLTSSMTEIEILNAIQDEKVNSLGAYTYTDAESYDNAYREIIKTRINNERIELTRLLGKSADSIK